MENIEAKALKTYENNLEFLKKNNTELYDKLSTLSLVISSNAYQENYSLEYLQEGYFDIKEMSSGNFLYSTNSILNAQEIIDKSNTSRFNGIFEGQRFVDFSPEMPDIINKSKLHFHNALWSTIKLIEYSKKVVPKNTTNMQNVYKLLFLGVGLGLHIDGISKKLGGKILFIKEDNLEIFRLSLFVTDYSKIGKNKELYFSIMQDKKTFKKTFLDFMERGYDFNLYLKYFPLNNQYENDLPKLQEIIMGQNHIMYPYSAYLLRFIEAPRYIAQNYPFLNISKRLENNIFTHKPILFLFSGPSTKKNIEWIQKNHKKFIVISALSTCKLLSTYKIKPNIIIHIDPENKGSMQLVEGIQKSYFKDIIAIFSSNVHPNVVNFFKEEKCYFIQQGANYKSGFGSFSSPTVGEYTYAIFLLFGAKNIHIIGIDLALDPDTLESHSQGYHPFAEKAQINNEDAYAPFDKSLIKVKGNFLPSVPTFPTYKLSIDEFSRFSTMMLTGDEKVYNLGNGAYLDGTIPMLAKDIQVNNSNFVYKEITQELNSLFKQISCDDFTNEDKKILIYQLKEAKKLKEIIKQYKKKTFALSKLYLIELNNLNLALSDMQKKTNSDLSEVYYYYFKVILSYISDIFNSKELTNPPKHIREVNKILIEQLDKMANLYIKTFEEYLK